MLNPPENKTNTAFPPSLAASRVCLAEMDLASPSPNTPHPTPEFGTPFTPEDLMTLRGSTFHAQLTKAIQAKGHYEISGLGSGVGGKNHSLIELYVMKVTVLKSNTLRPLPTSLKLHRFPSLLNNNPFHLRPKTLNTKS